MNRIIDKIRAFNIVPYIFIFYSVGIVGLLLPQTHELFKALVPLNLLLSLGLLLLYHGKMDSGFIWKALFIFIAGILVELVGVNTGIIFGTYEYGPTLGLKLYHTPIIIGVNWLMLVYCSLVIVSQITEMAYFRAILGASLMVVYDIVLEPAAIDLKMWDWGGPVPMQNYIAWFIISFLLICFADRFKLVNRLNKTASPLFFIQLLFFIILNLWILFR
jgi:putative membrane protein